MSLPTISAFSTVWPAASAIEARLKIINGSAASTSNCGVPNGNSCGTANQVPPPTPLKFATPNRAATPVPATRPSTTASWRSIPFRTRKNSTVSAMVAMPTPMFTGLPKSAAPGWPVISRPLTRNRLTPMMTINVPITTVGKNLRSRANTGRTTK